MPITPNGTIVCGAPHKSDPNRSCHIQVKRDGDRCGLHTGVVLESEVEQLDPVDEELEIEIDQYLAETDEVNSSTIDDEINFVNLQLRHLKRNYQLNIQKGEIGLAGQIINDITQLARSKAQLLKINDEIKINSGNYVPVHTMQEALHEFVTILENRLASFPDLLYQIKMDMFGYAEQDMQMKDDDPFNEFLAGLHE